MTFRARAVGVAMVGVAAACAVSAPPEELETAPCGAVGAPCCVESGCAAGSICTQGRCEAAPAPAADAACATTCDGACVSLLDDPTHCGRCDNACPDDAICNQGACACVGGRTMCEGRCADTAVDNVNCGGCGRACAPTVPNQGARCGASVCRLSTQVTFGALPFNSPISIVADAQSLYWVNGLTDSGPVYKVDKSGATDPVLLTTSDNAGEIRIDDAYVYVLVAQLGVTSGGSIKRVSKAGGAATVLATGLTMPRALALGTNDVFWGVGNAVARVAKTGGAVTTAVVATAEVTSISVDTTHVYWADHVAGRIERAPRTGGAVELLTAANDPWRLVVSDGWVYYAERGSKTIRRVFVTGGIPQILAATELASPGTVDPPFEIAVDDAYVYWNQYDVGSLFKRGARRVPKAGGAVVELSDSGYAANAVAVDEGSFYWAGANVFVRVSPK